VRLRRVVEESRRAVEELKCDIKEKEGVIERLRGELVQKGDMGGKLGGGSGWTGQRVEKVKRADKMMELLVKMDAREKGAYDPL
jgi:predicted RNase H-like nuclease (RuvC/YqgF family)